MLVAGVSRLSVGGGSWQRSWFSFWFIIFWRLCELAGHQVAKLWRHRWVCV